jgi:hypothetical protein
MTLSDVQKLADAGKQLTLLDKELASLEEQWLDLSEQIESVA